MTEPMKFQNAEHERVYRQLGEILKGLYGKSAAPDSRNIPQYWLRSGSADMLVAVMPAGEKNASVWLQAWVNVGAEASREYYEFLLKAQGNMRFGAFFLDEQGNCGFAYQFPAAGLNEATLEWAINAIITTADEYDDKISQRFGGKRPSDK